MEGEAHTESLKSDNINKLSKVMKEQAVHILKAESVLNAELSNKIGGLIISVYTDMKQITLTAFSCPSRIVAAEMAQLFDYNVDLKHFDAINFDFLIRKLNFSCRTNEMHSRSRCAISL